MPRLAYVINLEVNTRYRQTSGFVLRRQNKPVDTCARSFCGRWLMNELCKC